MFRFHVFLLLAAASTQVSGQDDGSTDESRPYKFAFNIEGYQHRSEMKDNDGIIMGEFGFVTGDGIYHVTVYATDKDGDFKIISMKSYYVGLPGEPTTTQPPPTSTTQSNPKSQKNAILQHLEGLMGCSSCLIPSKGAGSPPGKIPGENQLNMDPGFNNVQGPQTIFKTPIGSTAGKPGSNFGVQKTPGIPTQQPGKPPASSTPFGGQSFTPSSGKIDGKQPTGGSKQSSFDNPPTSGKFPFTDSKIPSNRPTSQGSIQPEHPTKTESVNTGNSPPTKYFDGLPPGMTMEDLQALLYKFNYTLRFHGHHESGYRSGDKEGGYFFNGRDGFGRDVKYIANEFGFQPNISLVELGLDSPDTPKEDTEKELNELRGNEFKWFYQR